VTDRLIGITTALAVVAVAGVMAIILYQHAYELVRSHGESGVTAHLLPFTVDGLIWAASMFSGGLFAAVPCGTGVPSETFCNTSRECGARCRRCSAWIHR